MNDVIDHHGHSPDIGAEMGISLGGRDSGRADEAEKLCEKILAVDPKNPNALHMQGMLALRAGKNERAANLISRAIQGDPTNPAYYGNLGLAMRRLGKATGAVACYKKALDINPDYFEALFGLGEIFQEQCDLRKALNYYEKAAIIKPEHAQTYVQMGHVHKEEGRFSDAVSAYEKALKVRPEFAEVYHHLAIVFREQQEFGKVIHCYREALKLEPNHPEAYHHMGFAFQLQDRLSDAVQNYRKAIEMNPEYAEAHNNVGVIYCTQGNLKEALFSFEKACKLKSGYAQAHSNLLMTMQYDPKTDDEMLFYEAKKWWKQCGLNPSRPSFQENVKEPHKRLRVGYVSPDFRQHSVSWFFLPLLKEHDRELVEIFCYSDAKKPDAITYRVKDLSDHWRSTAAMTDEMMARQIHRDHIDILLDLSGHTRNNRLTVFACKPAQVQVTWLGYPGTTGLPVMDYRITDAVSDPPGDTDLFHSEKLIRLPRGFICYSPPDRVTEVSRPPASATSGITFGSFNNPPKINQRVVSLWSRILHQTPRSNLLVKHKAFGDESTKLRYLDLFLKNGIPGERLRIMGHVPSVSEHLSTYDKVDIGLDTFPYNGTTTTCEALWMGVPVITRTGNRHASRVGASIMNRVGLTELIAATENKYIEKAVRLAKDMNYLAELRDSMRKRMQESPLCDAISFAREMENAFFKMLEKPHKR